MRLSFLLLCVTFSQDSHCVCFLSPGFHFSQSYSKRQEETGRKTRGGNIYQWHNQQLSHYLKADRPLLHFGPREAGRFSPPLFCDDSRPDGVRASVGPRLLVLLAIDGPMWPATRSESHSLWLWLCAFKDTASMSRYDRSSSRRASQNMSKYEEEIWKSIHGWIANPEWHSREAQMKIYS